MPVNEFNSLLDVAYDICDEDEDGYVSVWEIMRIIWKLWRMNV